jgi:hypothetical protein
VNIVNQAWPIGLMGNLDPVLIGVAAPTINRAALRSSGNRSRGQCISAGAAWISTGPGEIRRPGAQPIAAIAGEMDKNVLKEIVAASNSRY